MLAMPSTRGQTLRVHKKGNMQHSLGSWSVKQFKLPSIQYEATARSLPLRAPPGPTHEQRQWRSSSS